MEKLPERGRGRLGEGKEEMAPIVQKKEVLKRGGEHLLHKCHISLKYTFLSVVFGANEMKCK